MASLVRFYYSWKKSRSKTSLMDRHARKHRRERDRYALVTMVTATPASRRERDRYYTLVTMVTTTFW